MVLWNSEVCVSSVPRSSTTAVSPETAACRTARPVSAARSCEIATCCSEFAERRYERLLVDSTMSWAPSCTSGRTWYPNADSKQMIVAIRCPWTLISPGRLPGSKSTGTCFSAPISGCKVERQGTYSPNGTRWRFEYVPTTRPSGANSTSRFDALPLGRSAGPFART